MLIKIRLVFYTLALLHLVCIVCYLITIDFTQMDERFRIYHHMKWKLITTWFNLITLAYLPFCLYCDWRELRGQDNWTHVRHLNRLRSACFSNIILPTTVFADLMYWRLYYINSELITPKGIDEVVPFWTQHSMHTVSLLLVLLDLVLVPRKRPERLKPGLLVTFTFVLTYIAVVVHSKMRGEYLYPILKTLSDFESFVLVIIVFAEHALYYTGQWLISDFIWRRKNNLTKIS